MCTLIIGWTLADFKRLVNITEGVLTLSNLPVCQFSAAMDERFQSFIWNFWKKVLECFHCLRFWSICLAADEG